MRISDWSSDVCSSDLSGPLHISVLPSLAAKWLLPRMSRFRDRHPEIDVMVSANNKLIDFEDGMFEMAIRYGQGAYPGLRTRSEEHTSEIQSLMRRSYAVFCLKKTISC